MPESAQQWYAGVRAGIDVDGYREAAWLAWPSWPLEGAFEPRPLEPPGEEQARSGAGGVDCVQCARSQADDPSAYVFWRDDLAMLGTPFGGSSLPFCCFLMTRRHADLSPSQPGRGRPDRRAAEVRRARVLRRPRRPARPDRALGRRLGAPALVGLSATDGSHSGSAATFLTLWDGLLPLPDEARRADLDLVANRLVELIGGEALPQS